MSTDKSRELFDEMNDVCQRYGVRLINTTVSDQGLKQKLSATKDGTVTSQLQPSAR